MQEEGAALEACPAVFNTTKCTCKNKKTFKFGTKKRRY